MHIGPTSNINYPYPSSTDQCAKPTALLGLGTASFELPIGGGCPKGQSEGLGASPSSSTARPHFYLYKNAEFLFWHIEVLTI